MQRKSPDLQGDLVGIEARLDKDQVGAFALGGDRRHRGMNPELARFIACRRDDAAFARSADRHRLPTQFGIIALFDRRVERVHVDMDDFADTVRRRLFRAVPDPHARTALENGLRPGALSLSPRRMQMALKASAFLAACAKVGLEALIDEATGAQYDRAQDALQVKLKAYLEDDSSIRRADHRDALVGPTVLWPD